MEFKDLIAVIGVLVSIATGFVMWRVQLIGKRKTEVAEEALITFRQAVDALEYVRSPFTPASDLVAALKEAGLAHDVSDPTTVHPASDFLVTLWRANQQNERFAPIRKAELLCLYHFGASAAGAFADLNGAIRSVVAAAKTALAVVRRPDDRHGKSALRLEERIWPTADPDPIEEQVKKAQRDLEEALTPHLRSDAWLLPLAAGRDRAKAWGIASAARTNAWAKEMIWGKPGT